MKKGDRVKASRYVLKERETVLMSKMIYPRRITRYVYVDEAITGAFLRLSAYPAGVTDYDPDYDDHGNDFGRWQFLAVEIHTFARVQLDNGQIVLADPDDLEIGG